MIEHHEFIQFHLMFSYLVRANCVPYWRGMWRKGGHISVAHVFVQMMVHCSGCAKAYTLTYYLLKPIEMIGVTLLSLANSTRTVFWYKSGLYKLSSVMGSRFPTVGVIATKPI